MERIIELLQENIFSFFISGILSVSLSYIIYIVLVRRFAREVSKYVGITVSKPVRYFKSYVDHDFETLYQSQKQTFTFRELYKKIITHKTSSIIFICAESGIGKTRLMQQLVYKLLLHVSKLKLIFPNVTDNTKVVYKRFCDMKSLDELIDTFATCDSPSETYVLLDGLDEFPALIDFSANDILDYLFDSIDKIASKFQAIVISTRVESFSRGTNTISEKAIWNTGASGLKRQENVLTLKIKAINNVLKIYDSIIKSDLDINYSRKESKVTKKILKNYLDLEKDNNVLNNPFFIRYADSWVSYLNIDEIATTKPHEILDIIVNHCFKKEYDNCRYIGLIKEQEQYESFRTRISQALIDVAEIMINKNCIAIEDFEITIITTNPSFLRTFLVRNGNSIQFIHAHFFCYFVIKGIFRLDYKIKSNIFNYAFAYINVFDAISHYLYLLENNYLDIADKLKSSVNGDLKEMISANSIVVKDNPILNINEILDLLPCTKEIIYDKYILRDDLLLDYMYDKYLDLNSLALKSLKHIENFGEVNHIDISGNNFDTLSYLCYLTKIDSLTISRKDITLLHEISNVNIDILITEIASVNEINVLLDMRNILTLHISVIDNYSERIIELYHELRNIISTGRVLVINAIDQNIIIKVLQHINDRYKDSNEKSLNISISFLEDVLYAQTNEMLDINSENMFRLKGNILAQLQNRIDLNFFKQKYEYCLKDTIRAIKLDPNNAVYYHSFGYFSYEMKRYDEALPAEQKAVILDPNNAIYHHFLGVIFHEMQRYDEALAATQKAVALDPNNAMYYHILGVIFHDLKRYDEALAATQKAVDLDPNLAIYHHNLGILFYEMKRYDEALAASQKTVALDPNLAIYHHNLGVIFHNLKRYDEALSAAQNAVDLDPNNVMYRDRLSMALYDMERYDEALAITQKAIALDPDNALYHSGLGLTLLQMGRYDEALAAKQKAVDLDSDNAMYHNSLGLTLHQMGRYDEALAAKQKAVDLDPDNAIYYDSLSGTLHDMERYDEALAATQKAIALNPDNAEYHDSLGVTLHEMERYDEALAAKQKAVVLNPDYAAYHDSLGVTLHEMERYDEALSAEQKAVDLDPNNAIYHHNLSVTLHEMERYDETLAAIQKANALDSDSEALTTK